MTLTPMPEMSAEPQEPAACIVLSIQNIPLGCRSSERLGLHRSLEQHTSCAGLPMKLRSLARTQSTNYSINENHT